MPFSDDEKATLLTNKMEIHIIELDDLENDQSLDEELRQWCIFLKHPERIGDSIMNENEEIKAAKEELEKINSSALEKRRADEREKAILDEIWMRNNAINKGREEGIVQGLAEGRAEEKNKIAKKMLQEKMPVDLISKITGLSVEEIKLLEE